MSAPYHKVTRVGRLQFHVPSHSRLKLKHVVDLEGDLKDTGELDPKGEPYRCDCEAFRLLVHRPCRHVRDVVAFALDSLGLGENIEESRQLLDHGMHPREVVRYFLKSKPAPTTQPAPTKRQYQLKPRPSIQSKK